jgi:hypothetical protein
LDVFGEGNGHQAAKLVVMLRRESALVRFEEPTTLVGVVLGNKIQERVDEDGPKKAAEFRL